jgi:hypothetical protein
MRRAALLITFMLTLPGAAEANWLGEFLRGHPPQEPVAESCDAGGAWYGRFGGTRIDPFVDSPRAVSYQGCFSSEWACRRWQNEAITYLEGGPIHATSCRLRG